LRFVAHTHARSHKLWKMRRLKLWQYYIIHLLQPHSRVWMLLVNVIIHYTCIHYTYT
jgi:hypothetical protein